MKQKIIALLKERHDYVSGQELCEIFDVSRTAIWKAIEQLKKSGYVIEAVRNRGYLLVEEDTDVFSAGEIQSGLNTKVMARDCLFYPEIGSTNTEAKRLAEEGAREGLLIVADCQTAGRGRRGRTWVSPKGINSYFTLLLRPEVKPDNAPMLTLVMALAVVKGIRTLMPELSDSVKIKWPNDVVINGKKICGILTEMSAERDYIQYVVIGVGINVKVQKFEKEFSDRATSIDMERGTVTSRSKLVAAIMNAFEVYYSDYLRTGNLSYLKEEYEGCLVNKDRQVCVLDPQGEYSGMAVGINDTGELLVKREDDTVTAVYAGEVSVRGIYGYV